MDLPESLVLRLERQVAYMGHDRRSLIETAVASLVREFEQIDAECGVACPDCAGDTEVDTFPEGRFRVCVRCYWRWREPEL